MSACCTCGCGGTNGCCLRIVLPENPVELYAMENINTLGIGVYDSTNGNTFQMRGLYSGNASIVVALDAGNNAISITLNIDQIIDDLPQATTTQRGVGETATDAEAIAKASITTFLTPSNLAALGASLTFAGLVELATNAETQAGASTTLAVTPAGLASVVATIQGTQVWADGAARGGATPDFDGQMGVQLSSRLAYISSGPALGDFDIPLFALDSVDNVLQSTTQLDLNSQLLTFSSGDVSFGSGTFTFINGTLDLGVGVLNINFGAACVLQDNGVTVPASSVLTTSSTAGQFNSLLLNTFLSNSNTTVWGLPTGTLSRTALAAYAGQNISNPPTEAEVQALDDYVQTLSQKVCALITDLRATLKPHAT